MKQILSILTLAASGALVVTSAGAAQPASPRYIEAAVAGPAIGPGNADTQRDVIQPPLSIDPGMALDPPQTGARMPIVRPPGTADHLVSPH